MRRNRNIIMSVIILVGIICTFIYTNVGLSASEFEGNENYWRGVCSAYQQSSETRQKCSEYETYLNGKKQDAKDRSAAAQKEIDALQGDLLGLANLAQSYREQISSVETRISEAETAILALDTSMEEAQTHIDEKQVTVDARREDIKKRMLGIQVSINTNQYINYIMGSEDLVKFIEKTENVNKLTEANNEQIKLMNSAIAELNDEKAEQQRLKDTKVAEQAALDASRLELADLQANTDAAIAAIDSQRDAYIASKGQADNDSYIYAGLTPSIALPPIETPPANTDTGGSNSGGSNSDGNNSGGDSGGTTTPPANPGIGNDSLGWARNFYGPYYTSSSPFAQIGLTGQCTWYVWGRIHEINGNVYVPTGHAGTWANYAASAGLPVGDTPRANAIMVWGGGPYGHVAFVEKYANGMISVSEANVGVPGGGLGYWTDLETAIYYTKTYTTSYAALVQQRGAPRFIYY